MSNRKIISKFNLKLLRKFAAALGGQWIGVYARELKRSR